MDRRTFINYSFAATASGLLVPHDIYARSWAGRLWRMVKVAARVHVVRFVSGLVFDQVKSIVLEPLAKSAYRYFVGGGSVSRSSLSYYSASDLRSESFHHEPYKAATAVLGVSDYELYVKEREQRMRLLLNNDIDKKRFEQVARYYRDEQVKMKLYTSEKTFTAGDLEPDDLFNLDYVAFKGDPLIHSKNLLEITQNRAFEKLIV